MVDYFVDVVLEMGIGLSITSFVSYGTYIKHVYLNVRNQDVEGNPDHPTTDIHGNDSYVIQVVVVSISNEIVVDG